MCFNYKWFSLYDRGVLKVVFKELNESIRDEIKCTLEKIKDDEVETLIRDILELKKHNRRLFVVGVGRVIMLILKLLLRG